MKVRKGDTVAILSGKDAGAQGRVLEVIPKKNRLVVEGVNTVTRHEKVRMDRRGTQQGGIEHKEAAVNISNVTLVCPTDGPTRVGYRVDEAGTRIRVCKKCGTEL